MIVPVQPLCGVVDIAFRRDHRAHSRFVLRGERQNDGLAYLGVDVFFGQSFLQLLYRERDDRLEGPSGRLEPPEIERQQRSRLYSRFAGRLRRSVDERDVRGVTVTQAAVKRIDDPGCEIGHHIGVTDHFRRPGDRQIEPVGSGSCAITYDEVLDGNIRRRTNRLEHALVVSAHEAVLGADDDKDVSVGT